jgi:hypothetical protein
MINDDGSWHVKSLKLDYDNNFVVIYNIDRKSLFWLETRGVDKYMYGSALAVNRKYEDGMRLD